MSVSYYNESLWSKTNYVFLFIHFICKFIFTVLYHKFPFLPQCALNQPLRSKVHPIDDTSRRWKADHLTRLKCAQSSGFDVKQQGFFRWHNWCSKIVLNLKMCQIYELCFADEGHADMTDRSFESNWSSKSDKNRSAFERNSWFVTVILSFESNRNYRMWLPANERRFCFRGVFSITICATENCCYQYAELIAFHRKFHFEARYNREIHR